MSLCWKVNVTGVASYSNYMVFTGVYTICSTKWTWSCFTFTALQWEAVPLSLTDSPFAMVQKAGTPICKAKARTLVALWTVCIWCRICWATWACVAGGDPTCPGIFSQGNGNMGSENLSSRSKVLRLSGKEPCYGDVEEWHINSSLGMAATQGSLEGAGVHEPGLQNRWSLHRDVMGRRREVILHGEGTACQSCPQTLQHLQGESKPHQCWWSCVGQQWWQRWSKGWASGFDIAEPNHKNRKEVREAPSSVSLSPRGTIPEEMTSSRGDFTVSFQCVLVVDLTVGRGYLPSCDLWASHL